MYAHDIGIINRNIAHMLGRISKLEQEIEELKRKSTASFSKPPSDNTDGRTFVAKDY